MPSAPWNASKAISKSFFKTPSTKSTKITHLKPMPNKMESLYHGVPLPPAGGCFSSKKAINLGFNVPSAKKSTVSTADATGTKT